MERRFRTSSPGRMAASNAWGHNTASYNTSKGSDVTAFPIERVRSQFPALSTPVVFLDNPAGTQVPRAVIEAVSAAMVAAASNTGGYFQASVHADAIVARAPRGQGGRAGAGA